MLFDNIFNGIEFLGEPAFVIGRRRDVNPLSRLVEMRILEIPNESMRRIHGRLLSYLRSLPLEYRFATGCRPGDSPRKNVERHRGNRFFYLVDLKKAYRQVKVERLAEILCQTDSELNGQDGRVTSFLENYCRSRFGGLVMGASASQDLFNLYCLVLLDNPLEELVKRYGLTYTRYLDDLTFSSGEPIGRVKRKQIRGIIQEAGFPISHRKARVYDLRKGTIVINGVGLEYGGRIFVPGYFVNFLRGLLHRGVQNPLQWQSEIAGAMGVFKGLIDPYNLTETEKKILEEYRQFRYLAHSVKASA